MSRPKISTKTYALAVNVTETVAVVVTFSVTSEVAVAETDVGIPIQEQTELMVALACVVKAEKATAAGSILLVIVDDVTSWHIGAPKVSLFRRTGPRAITTVDVTVLAVLVKVDVTVWVAVAVSVSVDVVSWVVPTTLVLGTVRVAVSVRVVRVETVELKDLGQIGPGSEGGETLT